VSEAVMICFQRGQPLGQLLDRPHQLLPLVPLALPVPVLLLPVAIATIRLGSGLTRALTIW